MVPTHSPRLRKGSPRPDISCHIQDFQPCTSRCTLGVKRGLIPKDSVTPLTLHHVSLVQSNITPVQNMQSSRRPPQILTQCSSLELRCTPLHTQSIHRGYSDLPSEFVTRITTVVASTGSLVISQARGSDCSYRTIDGDVLPMNTVWNSSLLHSCSRRFVVAARHCPPLLLQRLILITFTFVYQSSSVNKWYLLVSPLQQINNGNLTMMYVVVKHIRSLPFLGSRRHPPYIICGVC